MPKKSHKFIQGKYVVDCPCGYKATNNKAMILHKKYSHGKNISINKEKNYDVVCGICKKKNCTMH